MAGRGGRRGGAGSPAAMTKARTALAVAPNITLTQAQHRAQLREVFTGWGTPERLVELLDEAFAQAKLRTTVGARSLDLLLRLMLGNPAVFGETAEGRQAGDSADALRQLIAALPPGTVWLPGQRAEEAAPGVYSAAPDAAGDAAAPPPDDVLSAH